MIIETIKIIVAVALAVVVVVIFFIIIIFFVFVDPPTKGPYTEIVRAAEGTQVNFSCPVDGRPEPTITWYKGNDTTCKLQDQGRDWTFQAESNDAGWYSCFAANFLNPFKPINASFLLIVGKFCWVLFFYFFRATICYCVIWFLAKERRAKWVYNIVAREARAQFVNRVWVLASRKLAALIFTCIYLMVSAMKSYSSLTSRRIFVSR